MKTDGNVIEGVFGKPQEHAPLLDFACSCRWLFLDEHLAVMRITYRINGKEFIQHVVKGTGLEP